MSLYEAGKCLEAYNEQQREGWEKLRIQCYFTLLPNLKDGTSMKKMMPLPWDKEAKPNVISKKELEGLKQRSEHIMQLLIKRKDGR